MTQGLLLYNCRIVVPQSLRKTILGKLHDGHMGINKCQNRAEQAVWWPGISSDIKAAVASCSHCQEHRPSQRSEPLISTPLPDKPWERVGVDMCHYSNQDYMIIMDYYSRYIEVIHMRQTTINDVVLKMKNVFARWGVPLEIISDKGPQIAAKAFKDFANEYTFKSITSSPKYPQSNGLAP